ncbi:MAG: hypothetical protein WCQ53_02465 [bacterium]
MFSRATKLFRGFFLYVAFAIFLFSNALYSQQYYENILKQFQEKVDKTSFKKVNILNAGWEGGSIILVNQDDASKTKLVTISYGGGMAVVTSELAPAMVEYGKERGIDVTVNAAHPYIEGSMSWPGMYKDDVSQGKLECLVKEGFFKYSGSYTAHYAGKAYDTEVYESKTEFGKVYLLKSNAWTDKFGAGDPYALTDAGLKMEKILEGPGYSSNNSAAMNLVEERASIIIGQNVADLYNTVKADAALLHDYHLSLALFYNDKIKPVIVGHNPVYQGIMGFDYKAVPSWDHMGALKNLALRLNVSEDVVHKYFRIWASKNNIGAANIYQAITRKAKELTGVSMTSVSPGETELIGKTLAELIEEIKLRSDIPLTDSHFYPENIVARYKTFYKTYLGMDLSDEQAHRFVLAEESRGVDEIRTANIVPVLNGLSRSKHASINTMLQEVIKDPDYFTWKNRKIPAYIKEVVAKDSYFSEGLNFDADNVEKMAKAQAYIRRIMLMEFFPHSPEIWDNTTSYIRYGWGRLTEQKFWEIGISSADDLTKNGDIFILLAPISPNSPDEFYKEIGAKTSEKAKAMQAKGKWFSFTTDFNALGAFLSAGADENDFFSLREPCGLVDKEGMGYGTVFVTHRVGGLGYGAEHVGFYFDGDPTDPGSMRRSYIKTTKEARAIWAADHKAWIKREVAALKMDYTYKRPANAYIDLIYSAILKDAMNNAVEIGEAYKQGKVVKDVYDRMLVKMNEVPEEIRLAIMKYGQEFSSYDWQKAFFYGVDAKTLPSVFSAEPQGNSPVTSEVTTSENFQKWFEALSEDKIKNDPESFNKALFEDGLLDWLYKDTSNPKRFLQINYLLDLVKANTEGSLNAIQKGKYDLWKLIHNTTQEQTGVVEDVKSFKDRVSSYLKVSKSSKWSDSLKDEIMLEVVKSVIKKYDKLEDSDIDVLLNGDNDNLSVTEYLTKKANEGDAYAQYRVGMLQLVLVNNVDKIKLEYTAKYKTFTEEADKYIIKIDSEDERIDKLEKARESVIYGRFEFAR